MKNKTELSLISDNAVIVRCFEAALKNVAKTNTVRCKFKQYNKTGLIQHRYMIRAGRNYKTPWTRDASINTWQAMNFISPEVSKTTLLAVCDLNEKGLPVIQPDVQVWDQIVWAIGAYNYYLSSGDEEFAKTALGIIGRALETHRTNRFNAKYGLFVGGSFFNDGISGYPLSCHQSGLKNSFAPAHVVVETIMSFSTNCLYCEAYRIYGELLTCFGFEAEAEKIYKLHDALKATINNVFWSEELSRYRYIIFPDGSTDDSQEASGHAFAVLFDICPKERVSQLFEKLVVSDGGVVSVYPAFEGLYSEDKPGRHNNVVWPFLNGILIEAAATRGLYNFVGSELDRISELFKGSRYKLFEIYSPYTKKAFGGWQTGRVWDSCKDQTWSATCYIGALIYGVFGVRLSEKGISFAPCVPEVLQNAKLTGIKVRGSLLSVKVNGYGSKIKRFILDGKESESFIPWDNKSHEVEIELMLLFFEYLCKLTENNFNKALDKSNTFFDKCRLFFRLTLCLNNK